MPFFSIVIPVYNGANVVNRSVESCLTQSFSDIEIILIDDKSLDNSVEILRRYEKMDSRIRVIERTENGFAMLARRDGVAIGSGEYFLFLDADDTLSADACELLYAELNKQPVDVLHFGVNIINTGNVDQSDIKAIADFMKPYKESLSGKEILESCFKGKKYGWNLANKAFAAKPCKMAHEHIPSMRLLRGEDGFEYFAVAYYSDSYRGCPELQLYNYYYGSGKDGQLTIGIEDFEGMCSSSLVPVALTQFLETVAAPEWAAEAAEVAGLTLAAHSARQYRLKLRSEDRSAGFVKMMEKWGGFMTTCALAKEYWDCQELLARDVAKCKDFLEQKPKEVKVIGTYYHHFSGGGTENVQRHLLKLWRSMGYKVVVFTDNMPPEDIDMGEEADSYYLLPEAVRAKRFTFPERAKALAEAVKESGVDLFVYHYYDSQTLLFEDILLKSMNIPVFVYYHNTFSILLKGAKKHFAALPDIYGLVDGIFTLSEVDEMFWGQFCDRTYLVPSPYFGKKLPEFNETVEDKTILYLGRVAQDKHNDELLKIFDMVASRVPDARFVMVGGSGDAQYVEKIRTMAEESEYAERINFVGWDNNTTHYYEEARVFLGTSDVEGYPLTLIESKAAGLPCVMYDLPYLSLLREPKGLITVPFGEAAVAAEEVVRLLEDDEYCREMRIEAHNSVQDALSFDFEGLWKQIIAEVEAGFSRAPHSLGENNTEMIMWRTNMLAYYSGVSYLRKEIQSLKKQNKALKKELNKIKNMSKSPVRKFLGKGKRFLKRKLNA